MSAYELAAVGVLIAQACYYASMYAYTRHELQTYKELLDLRDQRVRELVNRLERQDNGRGQLPNQ